MATVLEEFLVKLGFQVDPAQHSRFQDAMQASNDRINVFSKSLIGVIDRFANLSTIASGAAAGLGEALNRIGQHFGALSFAAERIGAAPEKITAYENAIKMLGGTAEGARASLENIANVQRTTPGILQALFGVKQGTDPVEAMRQIGQHFASLIRQGPMGMAQALQEGKLINFDQADVLRVASENFDRFYTESKQRVANWGGDMQKAADLGREQAQQIDRLQQQWQGFTTYLYDTFGPNYVHALGVVNQWFDDNAPKIKTHIDALKSDFDSLTGGLQAAFKSLSPGQQTGVEVGGAVAAGAVAARVGGSIMGRLGGMIGLGGLGKLTGLGLFATVLGGLINDYETWKKDRDQAFINWDAWAPAIDKATSTLQAFNKEVLDPLADKLGVPHDLIPAFEIFATFLAGRWLVSITSTFAKAGLQVGGFWGKLNAINALLLAMEAWHKAQDPATYAPENLAPGSPFWTGIPEEEQKKYPNSPYNQRQQQGPSFWSSPWDWTKRRLGFGGGGASDARKAQVRDQLSQDLNVSKEAASGIVSNLNAESGIAGINERNPVVAGSRGGFGWAQWTGQRRLDFEAWAAKKRLDPASDAANYGFLVEELRNRYPDLLAQLQRGDLTASQAANLFFRYESGGAAELERNRPGHVAAAESIAKLPSAQPWTPGTPMWPSLFHGAPPAAPAPPSLDQGPAEGAAGQPTRAPDMLDEGPPVAGFSAPPDLSPAAAPAAPTPAQQAAMQVSNDNSKAIHVADNSVINVTGVADPDRAARLVDRNRDRIDANIARHLGSMYA